ncbi:hypothetical protein D5F01_LYC08909 [Larimichthys crocea]|uniref:Uncharacterized protein n=1 Tax=Larimichthys crocea TaxID=215358 RepID=A0A6G0IJ64_LARCR|nr:hypothetical protein D5F01_LYC08909 [Larimichthys crocea]
MGWMSMRFNYFPEKYDKPRQSRKTPLPSPCSSSPFVLQEKIVVQKVLGLKHLPPLQALEETVTDPLFQKVHHPPFLEWPFQELADHPMILNSLILVTLEKALSCVALEVPSGAGRPAALQTCCLAPVPPQGLTIVLPLTPFVLFSLPTRQPPHLHPLLLSIALQVQLIHGPEKEEVQA